jgi:hypothetical protein
MNGHTLYRDIWLAQVPPTLNFLKKIIKENNFKKIIEIGTNRGGLSIWLNDNKQTDCDFVTFDITSEFLKFSPEKENIKFKIGNCFDSAFEEIKNLILSDGQVLLLCDGGDKNAEFNLFSKFLKSDDVIMCHDYVDDFETYLNVQSKYNWQTAPESSLTAISSSVSENNLTPYLYEDGKNSIWGCFKKS